MDSYDEIAKARKSLRANINPFTLPPQEFIRKFRLNKQLVRTLIEDLTPFIAFSGHGGAVSVETKVFAALNFYATGSYQRAVGDSWVHCLGRTTAGSCIREVTNALNEPVVQLKWIRFPKTRAERRRTIAKNVEKFGIPEVLGFIDGTEVSIVTPPKNMNPQSFWTKKSQYALNCQIICDKDLLIMNILAKFPGSCNDKFIFKNSAARTLMQRAYNEEPCWLLGDSGYTFEPWCIIPILDSEPGSAEEYFTKRHCKARNTVERCIGVLKARFRCLLKDRALHYRPRRAAQIVKACCVLHNMCTLARLPEPEIENEGEEEGRPWVALEHEQEQREVEDEAEEYYDAQLDPAARNVQAAAQEVRRRLVEFLAAQRPNERQEDEEEMVDNPDMEYQLVLPF